jgi:HD-like signal output (HDOD) protein
MGIDLPMAKVHQEPGVLADLPPFPAIAIRVMQLLSDDDVRLKELSELIRVDQVFSGQIMRLANSPLFGFRVEIKSILQATALLGVDRIKAVVLTAGMRSYLRQPLRVPALRQCWRHSLASAIVSERLGQASLVEAGFAYTAGLLHDVGRLALMTAQPLRYAKLIADAEEGAFDVLDREREWFGIDHCEAGQWLLENWKLPQAFGVVAALHHSFPQDDTFDIIALVRAACLFANALGFAALKPVFAPVVEDIMLGLPDRERGRFSAYADTLPVDVAKKISSLD